jgi:hypothetical protein
MKESRDQGALDAPILSQDTHHARRLATARHGLSAPTRRADRRAGTCHDACTGDDASWLRRS